MTEQQWKTISVVGLGYIGLPTAALFASSSGAKVIGVDINATAVDIINSGKIHIVEADLDGVVHMAVSRGTLRATTTPEPADAFLIAVPTPVAEGHKPDISYIEAAARSVAPVLKAGNLVILESTSPVGATERMAELMAELRPDLSFPQQKGEESDIRVAHCPERVLPGKVLRELVENDRAVGGMTPRCSQAAVSLYKLVVQGECFVTDARTAEMCKLTENAFRDVNIAFANELSLICDRLGMDVWELIKLANRHPRVNILQPGPGVGGHCIAVDPWFIVASAPEQAKLIHTARTVNNFKPEYVLEQIKTAAGRFKKPKVACLGIAFKANIDDLRESPSLEIVEKLAHGSDIDILVVEPHIDALPKSLAGRENVALTGLDEALAQADVLALLVDHKEFASADRSLLMQKVVIDTRGQWR
jgi:UDP-N-acetyl-D-mannosaminuronic acid dehydrogenase